MKKRIGIVLILIGIIVLVFPFANTAWLRWQQQQIIAQIDENFSVGGGQSSELPSDADNTSGGNLTQDNRPRIRIDAPDPEFITNGDGLNYFGKISIPKIDVNMPLVEGTTDRDIVISAGHMLETAYPDQFGNCVIVGHRGYSPGRLFNRLNELKFGDRIIVTSGGRSSDYVVYKTSVVEPTDFSVIEQNNEHKLMTLITCTPLYSFEYRLIVQAVKLTD